MSVAVTIRQVRNDLQIAQFSEMVWDFFDFLRDRYPEMLREIDEYIERQNVQAELNAFRDHYNPPKGEAFLATVKDVPAGICLLKTVAGGGEMNRMYVRKNARRMGLGRQLATSVIDAARRHGHPMLFLDALYRHKEALPLYESLGFERYEPANEFQGNNPKMIHMRMTL